MVVAVAADVIVALPARSRHTVALAILETLHVVVTPAAVLALDLDGLRSIVALGARESDDHPVLDRPVRRRNRLVQDEMLVVSLDLDGVLARIATAVVAAPLGPAAVLVGIAADIAVADVLVVVDHHLAAASGEGHSIRALHASVALALLVAVDQRLGELPGLLSCAGDLVAVLIDTPLEVRGLIVLFLLPRALVRAIRNVFDQGAVVQAATVHIAVAVGEGRNAALLLGLDQGLLARHLV